MKKLILFVSMTFLLVSFLAAQTHIPAGNVSGTWNVAGSPYIIDGEIQIISGDQLTIDAGVAVEFSGHYKFIVYGRLLAEGTVGSMITFYAQTTATGWHGLRFIDTNTNGQDSSKVVFCDLEDGKATGTSPDYRGGAIYCLNSSDVLIQSSILFNNSALSNGGGIYLSDSDVVIDGVIISDNTASGAGGGIYLYNSDPVLNEVIISNNTATYDGAGLNCFNSSPTITWSQIYNNTTQWNGAGISCYNNSAPLIQNTTISSNLAFQSGSALAVLYNSDVIILNCIIWDNATNGVYVESGSSLSATYSDIMNGTGQTYFGTGCIASDPLFADPANDDYQITWANFPVQDITKSPCINTGDPASQPDPDGTRADMGALPYLQSGIGGTITLQGGTGNVQNVDVTAGGITVKPDAAGEYLINLAPGTYTVTAILEGYSADPVTGVIVNLGQVTTDTDITLNEILPGEIVGQVDLEGLGDPAEVLVSAGGESTHPYPVYDPYSGLVLYYEYLLELPQGSYDVAATKAGYQDSTITDVVVVSGNQTTNINFFLLLIKYDGWISGTITLKDGAGVVTNVQVVSDTASVNPDATGYYEIILENGTYDVTASLDDYTTVTITDVEVIANDTTTVDITLLNWEVIPGTQYTMIAYVTTSLDGEYLVNTGSNQVGAFGSGGTSDCRGIATWQEGNHPLWEGYYDLDGYWYLTMVSNNNSGTDTLSFMVYDTDTDSIYDCYETIIFEDCTIIPLDVVAQNDVDQDFSLNAEWNWISFNVHPVDVSIDAVLAPLGSDGFQIKDQTESATYTDPPGIWVGTLSDITDGNGYLLNMLNPVDPFTVTGYLINPEAHYLPLEYDSTLAYNWNWVGYYPNAELTLDEALASLGSSVIAVKTQSKSAIYVNGIWTGDLLSMKPGVSYKINMGAADTLTYPIAAVTKSDLPTPNISNPLAWNVLTGFDKNMIVIADVVGNDDQSSLSIGVFDEQDNCHSVGFYQNDVWYFTVVGGEAQTLHFEAINSDTGEYLIGSQNIGFQNDVILGEIGDPIDITLEPIQHPDNLVQLYRNQPNPFNHSTSIRYYIPESSHVELTIYNILGQKIKTLISTNQNPGEYTLIWDGLSDTGNRLLNGIYFYKLTTGASSVVRKMLMVQ